MRPMKTGASLPISRMPSHQPPWNYGIRANFTQFGKVLLKPSPYPPQRGQGSQYVARQFQPQTSETQATSGNPCAARIAGGDSRGAIDAGTRPLAGRYQIETDCGRFGGTVQPGQAQCRGSARGDFIR